MSSGEKEFNEWVNSALVGSSHRVSATILEREGRRTRLKLHVGGKQLTELTIDATEDPLSRELVTAFHEWKTNEDDRRRIETYVWDHLVGAEFTPKMPNLKIYLQDGPRVRDGTFRVTILLKRGDNVVRHFEFVDDCIGKSVSIRKH